MQQSFVYKSIAIPYQMNYLPLIFTTGRLWMKRHFAVFIAIICAAFILGGCPAKSAVVQTSGSEPPKAQQNAAAQNAAPSDLNKKTSSSDSTSLKAQRPAKEEVETSLMKRENQFADLRFDYNKYSLKPKARAKLGKIAAWLKMNKNFVIRIEGHCDERGSAEYNLALGEKRAAVAMHYLIKLGISKERISIISYGKDKPLNPDHNEKAWARNRRDHFVAIYQ
jgi:peptidoglycan-associated lipoprotein